MLLTQCSLLTSFSDLAGQTGGAEASTGSDASGAADGHTAADGSTSPDGATSCVPRIALLAGKSGGAYQAATYDSSWKTQTVVAASPNAVPGVPAIVATGAGGFTAVLPTGNSGVSMGGYGLSWLDLPANASAWSSAAPIPNNSTSGANASDDVLSLSTFKGDTVLTYLGHYYIAGATEPNAGYREHDHRAVGWLLGHSPDLSDSFFDGALIYAPSIASNGTTMFAAVGKATGPADGGAPPVALAVQSRSSLDSAWTAEPPAIVTQERLAGPPRIVAMRGSSPSYLVVFRAGSGLLMSVAYDPMADKWSSPVFVGGAPGFATNDVPAVAALTGGSAMVAARDPQGVPQYSVYDAVMGIWNGGAEIESGKAASPVALASSECGGAVAAYAVTGGALGVRVAYLQGATWGSTTGTAPTPVPELPADVTTVGIAVSR
jgi:hypothetical protein